VNSRIENALRRARRFNQSNPRAVRSIAVGVIAVYAISMLWPYFAATLVRG
jgi:hypothetical protein